MKLITFKEVQASHGKEFADKTLGFRRHHTDEHGEPYWTEDELSNICGLIDREDASDAKGGTA